MSLTTTVLWDGFKAILTKIPNLYLAGGVVVLLTGAVIGGKIWFHNKVEAAAQKEINAYIAKDRTEQADLTAIIIADNAKIKLQLQTTTNTITKIVTVNHDVIVDRVPDTKTILSDGWVSAFNSSVKGVAIDTVAASDATPSGVNADQALDVINTNNGICQANAAELAAAQQFLLDQQTAVAHENAKNKVKP
jgi:hypothetical protein